MDGNSIENFNSIEFLRENLRKQIAVYKAMLEVVRRERKALSSLDLKTIRESTYEKEILADDAEKLEMLRQSWIDRFSEAKDIDRDSVTIEVCVEKIDPKSFEEMARIKLALLHIIKTVHTQNAENQSLVQNALNETQNMKENILGLASRAPKTYGPKGTVKQDKQNNIGVIEQQA